MLVRGVTKEQMERVANDLGIRAEVREGRGNFLNVRLFPQRGSDTYRRTSASMFSPQRRVNAVCYHGHWEWMNELYLINDTMAIRTTMAHYDSREDFLTHAPLVGQTDIGPMVAPLPFKEACLCTWQY